MDIYGQPFGTCCENLAKAMGLPNSMFRIEDNDVLYLSVGYQLTPQGQGWFDAAVRHCPFCGYQLLTDEEIARRSNSRSFDA